MSPKKGVEISARVRNHTAQGLAVVIPLTDSDILLGNDFLKQFGSLNINYQGNVINEGWSMEPALIIEEQRKAKTKPYRYSSSPHLTRLSRHKYC